MNNKDDMFEISPNVEVGTEVLDPTMPSDLDFEQKPPSQELKPVQSSAPSHPQIFEPGTLAIKSYSVKGTTIFSLPPQYPIGSIAPQNIHTFPIKDLGEDQRSAGLWRIWESIVGYV